MSPLCMWFFMCAWLPFCFSCALQMDDHLQQNSHQKAGQLDHPLCCPLLLELSNRHQKTGGSSWCLTFRRPCRRPCLQDYHEVADQFLYCKWWWASCLFYTEVVHRIDYWWHIHFNVGWMRVWHWCWSMLWCICVSSHCFDMPFYPCRLQWWTFHTQSSSSEVIQPYCSIMSTPHQHHFWKW